MVCWDIKAEICGDEYLFSALDIAARCCTNHDTKFQHLPPRAALFAVAALHVSIPSCLLRLALLSGLWQLTALRL